MVVENNDIVGNILEGDGGGGGISLHSVSLGSVANNRIRDNRLSSSSSVVGAGIDIRWGGKLYVSGNEVTTNRYALGTIYINQHSAANGNVEIARNWVYRNEGAGGGAVAVLESGGVVVKDNVIAHNFHPAGLLVSGSSEWVTSTNNTIVGNYQDGIYLYDARLALFSTIAVSNGGYGLHHAGGSIYLSRNRNNVWGNVLGPTNISGTAFDVEEDPRFLDAANDQYGLRASSPCMDAGSPAYSSSDSYNGLSRPQGSGPDIGAYEMAPPVYLPLAMRDL